MFIVTSGLNILNSLRTWGELTYLLSGMNHQVMWNHHWLHGNYHITKKILPYYKCIYIYIMYTHLYLYIYISTYILYIYMYYIHISLYIIYIIPRFLLLHPFTRRSPITSRFRSPAQHALHIARWTSARARKVSWWGESLWGITRNIHYVGISTINLFWWLDGFSINYGKIHHFWWVKITLDVFFF